MSTTDADDRARRRARRLDDPRMERFRTRKARRLLAAAMCALLVAEFALFAQPYRDGFVVAAGRSS
jgi:hypothetical protein